MKSFAYGCLGFVVMLCLWMALYGLFELAGFMGSTRGRLENLEDSIHRKAPMIRLELLEDRVKQLEK